MVGRIAPDARRPAEAADTSPVRRQLPALYRHIDPTRPQLPHQPTPSTDSRHDSRADRPLAPTGGR
ncbi:hypothetical protein [Streptomyces acidiscabies]|uniref:hypothetical protein n=1 Tax=Streptomyces acidiscabies TaxID=42234 RepID=UPI00117C4A32|nr:hypothetical protein [Streptomyces acidiscabies]